MIEFDPTAPYDHPENGLVERVIGTLKVISRVILHQANLPECMWPQTILYVRDTATTQWNHR